MSSSDSSLNNFYSSVNSLTKSNMSDDSPDILFPENRGRSVNLLDLLASISYDTDFLIENWRWTLLGKFCVPE